MYVWSYNISNGGFLGLSNPFGVSWKAKYFKRSNTIRKKWDTGESHTWKHMLQNISQVAQYIEQKLNSGKFSFWQDNLLRFVTLAQFSNVTNRLNNSTVEKFQNEDNGIGKCSLNKPLLITQQISQLLKFLYNKTCQIKLFVNLPLMESSVVQFLGMKSGKRGEKITSTHLFGIRAWL